MHHRVYVGQVVSDKMEKTVVVAVPWVQRHRRYGKAIRRVTKLYAHDPRGECQMGDRVRLVEVRPLSRTKRWLVKNILYRREIVQAPELEAAVGAVVTSAASVEEPATDEATEAETEIAADEGAEAGAETAADEATDVEPPVDETPEAEAEIAADEGTEVEPPADEAPEAEAETAAEEATEAEPPADEASEAEVETATDEATEVEAPR